MTTVATRLHPLFERLVREFGYGAPTLDTFDSLVAPPGHTLLFLADDPERSKETLDLAVILPEIARAFYGRFDVVVLFPAVANAVAPRYGVRRWPALILLRDGQYVGSIEAIRDWDDYQSEVTRLLKREPSAPPQPIAARAEATTARDHH